MILNKLVKNALLFIFLLNLLIIKNEPIIEEYNEFNKFGEYSLTSLAKNIANMPEIYLSITDIRITYSNNHNLMEIIYYINLYDQNYYLIKPSNLPLLYNLGILCDFYSFSTKENIYSIANIFENKKFYCVEYSKLSEHVKFGIKVYKIKEIGEKTEFSELFFFSDKIININKTPAIQNNYHFDVISINKKYNKLLLKINEQKKKLFTKEFNNLLQSYIQPPLCFLKEDIAQFDGKWSFHNIYNNYFCFCKGESCLNINSYNMHGYQMCKYNFYLTIIDNNKYLYSKTDYLLSDFFDGNIEPSDAFPIFKEMIKKQLKAHYITMSWDIFSEYCLKKPICLNNYQIIYGIKRIDGDVLEKYLDLFLKLKVVVAAEKYDGIDNFFYNIDYITYIFLGHGVQYIKSYLYNDYLSPKNYNKMLLPPSNKFISLALQAGWKNEDIIKITCPKFDNYGIYKKKISFQNNYEKNESSIFLMFTWRKMKKGKNISSLYYDNIYNLLNNTILNDYFDKNNVKFYFCFHHALKDKKIIPLENENIKFISQNEISILLKNSCLIITDFSAILFDAIVQRKPLILFIPDGLDPNLKEIYTEEYFEVITKIKNGFIDLNEIFLDLEQAINKIIYYIENGFELEKEKLNFYRQFKLTNKGNTKKFIRYIMKLE